MRRRARDERQGGAAAGLRLGDIAIEPIVDIDLVEIDIGRLLPAAETGRLGAYPWLEPDHGDLRSGVLKLRMQSFLLRVAGLNILVDTCIGQHKERTSQPAWHRRTDRGFLDALAEAGVAADEVHLVFCTHLHADHVGWNTRLENGHWVPTFPRARYAMSGDELAHWLDAQTASAAPVNHGSLADSVLPAVESGQAIFVRPDEALAPGLKVTSLAGHTPHHLGLELSDGNERAVFCGDAIHSPVQIVEPQWASAFCSNPEQAIATRLNLLRRAADEDLLLVPAHFRGPAAVRIDRGPDGFLPRGWA